MKENNHMLYVIIGIIILAIVLRLTGPMGCGCFVFLVGGGFILWRIGLLGFVIRMISGFLRWLIRKIVYYYYKFFGEESSAIDWTRELILASV